jgi:hypothetical protein
MPTLSWDVFYRDHGAERGLKSLGTVTNSLHANFGKVKLGAAALGLAAGAALVTAGRAAVKFGADSVKAYNEAQKSQFRLQDAFSKFPRLADTSVGALQRYNSELAKKTRFDDDATASGQAVLAQFGLTGQQITQLTPLLQDYAARTGKDIPAAASVLGKALLGKGRALAAVGINFKDAGSRGKNFNQIVDGLRDKVGGFAQREGKTFAGQMEIIKNRFGEWQEALGGKLLPHLQNLTGGLVELMGIAEDVAPAFGELLSVFAGGGTKFGSFAALIRRNRAAITDALYGIADAFLVGADGAVGFGASAAAGLGKANIAVADTIDAVLAFSDMMAKIPGTGLVWQSVSRDMGSSLREQAIRFRASGEAALDFGDKVENGAGKAVKRTRAELERLRRQDVTRAEQREQADRLARAIKGIGDKGDGTTRLFRVLRGETEANSRAERRFEGRVRDARDALVANYRAAEKNGASKKELARITENARAELFQEFRQMGFSRQQAIKLANALDDVTAAQKRVPKATSIKIKYDTWVDEQNARLVQRAGRFAVQMSAGGSRADLARSPATMRFLTSGKNLPNGFGGPAGSLFTATEHSGRAAVQDRATDAVRSALRPAADRWAQSQMSSGPLGRITNGGAGRAAGIREGMRWATSGGTYPGHHPSMNKAWDFMISSRSQGDRIAGHLWANRQRLRLWYLIWNRRIISMTRPGAGWLPYFDGMSSNPNRAHTNHVHASWYANGTRNARQGLAVVGEHGPELVNFRGGERVSAVSTARPSGGSSVTYIINAPHYVGDKNDLKKALVDLDRQGALQVIKR